MAESCSAAAGAPDDSRRSKYPMISVEDAIVHVLRNSSTLALVEVPLMEVNDCEISKDSIRLMRKTDKKDLHTLIPLTPEVLNVVHSFLSVFLISLTVSLKISQSFNSIKSISTSAKVLEFLNLYTIASSTLIIGYLLILELSIAPAAAEHDSAIFVFVPV